MIVVPQLPYRVTPCLEAIKELSGYLRELGEQYAVNMLLTFGEKLLSQANRFDIEQIDVTLETYPTIIEKIQNVFASSELRRVGLSAHPLQTTVWERTLGLFPVSEKGKPFRKGGTQSHRPEIE